MGKNYMICVSQPSRLPVRCDSRHSLLDDALETAVWTFDEPELKTVSAQTLVV
ncbi:MAG: hypothetical protein VB035_06940 [Candidatus Fimivivens sp.]|nr:hypothetical protein [Candidatus Fimivivens sp.]